MNFVCIVFELGDKTLTLSSMENLIVQCNLIAKLRERFIKINFISYWKTCIKSETGVDNLRTYKLIKTVHLK